MAQYFARTSPRPHRNLPLQSNARTKLENGQRASHNKSGRIITRSDSYIFNAPGAQHGGISTDLTLLFHCCSGAPDEIVSIRLVDFEPTEFLDQCRFRGDSDKRRIAVESIPPLSLAGSIALNLPQYPQKRFPALRDARVSIAKGNTFI